MNQLRLKIIKSGTSNTNNRKPDWKHEIIRVEIVERPAELSSGKFLINLTI